MMFTLPNLDHYLAPPDVHEAEAQPSSGSLAATLLVSLIMAALHGLNAYYLLWIAHAGSAGRYGYDLGAMLLFLGVHVLLVFVTFLYAKARQRVEQNDQRFDMLLVVATLTMGVAGALGTLLAILFFGFYQRYALSFAEWFASIFPITPATLPEVVYEDILTGRDESAKAYSVIPFLDVMAIGSQSQKHEALSKMTTLFHPSFAPAFRRALADENNAIRVQAATSVAKLENQFLERSIQIEALHHRHMKDDQLLLALARHYDDYAYTGILDAEREEANRIRALEAYEDYLSRHPGDVQVRLYAGRLLLRSGRHAEAAEWFRQSIDGGYGAPQTVTWYMECLYRLGRYDQLRRFAERFDVATLPAAQPALAESLRLWAMPPAEKEAS